MSQPARLLLLHEDRAMPACPVGAARALDARSPRNALALAQIVNVLAQAAADAVLEADA